MEEDAAGEVQERMDHGGKGDEREWPGKGDGTDSKRARSARVSLVCYYNFEALRLMPPALDLWLCRFIWLQFILWY